MEIIVLIGLIGNILTGGLVKLGGKGLKKK